ncbi:MAG TPA: aldo/keto reductase [Anaerolineae bacterium]
MKTFHIADTILNVSRIAYGCMTIGGGWSRDPLTEQTRKSALAAIQAALDQGINFFDHADIYGRGRSEEVFSSIWQESPGLRGKIVLQTKCGIRFAGDPDETAPGRYDFSYAHIVRSVEGSLKRLKTDFVDVLLLHRPDALVEPEEVARAFDELHQSGKVRSFGVSNHTAAQIALLQKYVHQPLIVNQLELNILHSQLIDEGVVFNQDQPARVMRGEGTLEYCRLHNIAIQAWAPLAGGAMTGTAQGRPSEAAANVSRLVAQLAREKNVSPEAIAIAWLLRHPVRIQPIIGTTNPARIKAACGGDAVELTREEWYTLFIAGRGGALP